MSPQWRRCSSDTVLHVLNGTALVLVHIFQSCVLNYYIISPSKDSLRAYFWFALDFVMMFVFIGSLAIAHQYLQCKRRDQLQRFIYSPKRLIKRYPRSQLGVLPLSYLAWLLHATLIIAKLSVIFLSQVPNTLKPTDRWGPQLLKIGIASSGAIFMLLVEGHHDAEPTSARNAYIRLLCSSTAFEIMDSVQFLSLLIVSDTHFLTTFTFERAILSLSAINFVLPTITLYKLSLSEFGLSHESPLIVAAYRLLHLVLVNVCYLAVRVYMWNALGGDISLFLMKNLLGVCTTLYALYPDLMRMCGCSCGVCGCTLGCCGCCRAYDQDQADAATDHGQHADLELDDVMTVEAVNGDDDDVKCGAQVTMAMVNREPSSVQT